MVKDMIKAVNEVLKTNFPGIKTTAQSVKEGFSRSTFFSSLDNPASAHTDPLTIEHSSTARIVYFPSTVDENEAELVEMADALFESFSMNLQINADTIADVQDFTSNISEGILTASFDITYTEILPDSSEYEMMEELNYK